MSKTIFELPAIEAPIADTDVLPLDTGLETFKATGAELVAYVRTSTSDFKDLQRGAAPASPDTGFLRVYADEDGALHTLDEDDVDTELGAGGGGGFTNPMTTQGDIIIGGASGVADRLAIGVKGTRLKAGSSSPEWGWQSIHSVSSANYTVTDTDGYDVIRVTTGASDRTVTLPTAADNAGRRLTIIKADNGAGNVIVDGEGSEVIGSRASYTILSQHAVIEIICNGTSWDLVSLKDYGTFSPAVAKSGGSGTLSSATVVTARYVRNNHAVQITLVVSPITVTTNSITIQASLPFPSVSAVRFPSYVNNNGTIAPGRCIMSASSTTIVFNNDIDGGSFNIAAGTSEFQALFTYECE